MKTLSQYREDIRALVKKGADIDAKATNENRDLSVEELRLKNDMMDAICDLKKITDTLERQERVAAALESPDAPVTIQKSQPKASEVRAQDRFGSFGEQMTAVMKAGQPGGKVDPRLYNAASGLNESVPSDGGLI